MFRIALARTCRAAAVSNRNGFTVISFRRLESTKSDTASSKASDAFKTAQHKQNAMLRDWDAKKLTYEEVKPKTLSPSPNAYLIDVREPDEVIQGSIPSSVNLPLSTLGNDLHLSREAFKEKFGFEKPRKDQEIIFYCRSGKRSATASDVAKRNGYTNIYNYEGSWLDWVEREGNRA